MDWVQADLDAINAVIASGDLKVKYADKEVEYRSMRELLEARDLIRKELGVTDGRNKRIFSEHSRGY